ncbi:MAG: T9SS type A sorting domain-containing protein [Sphingobacteriales bacterium]|nr:MAG: T9SS type A sorting domain-containing protein [Sphingobacteriales bacterium]
MIQLLKNARLYIAALLLISTCANLNAQFRNTTETQLYNAPDVFAACDSVANYSYTSNTWKLTGTISYKTNAAGYLTYMREWLPNGSMIGVTSYSRNAANYTTEVNKNYNGSPYGKTDLTYSNNNLVTEELIYTPNGNTFEEFQRFTYQYDGNKNMISKIHEQKISSDWNLKYKEENTFNSSNQLAKTTFYRYENPDSLFPTDQYIYKYDNKGNLTERTWLQNMESVESWNYFQQLTYAYDANSNRLRTLTNLWNGLEWQADRIDSNFYNSKVYSISYEMPKTTWVMSTKRECALQNAVAPVAPSNLSVSPYKKKDDAKMMLTWKDNSAIEDGFIIYRSKDGNTWQNVDSTATNITTFTDTDLAHETKYYYRIAAFNAFGVSGFSNMADNTTFTGIAAAINKDMKQLQLYPNPCRDILYITANVENSQLVNITLRDITGKNIVSENIKQWQSGENNTQINTADLPAGIYYIILRSSHINQVQKIVVSK